jgi:hypothetical protein
LRDEVFKKGKWGKKKASEEAEEKKIGVDKNEAFFWSHSLLLSRSQRLVGSFIPKYFPFLSPSLSRSTTKMGATDSPPEN